MRNHITPPKLQYILQYTDSNGVLQNVDVTPDFSTWDAFETDIVRDDLSGAFIQIQDGGITFTGDSYDLVRSIYETQGFRAVAKLIVNIRKDTFPDLWTYEQKVSLDLNFAKYVRDNTTITLTANENGLKAMVKANSSQKYDIPVTDLSPETLVYDGLEIKETFTWFPAPVVGVPVIQTLTGAVGQTKTVEFAPGIQSMGQDINANYINWLTQQSQLLSIVYSSDPANVGNYGSYSYRTWNSSAWVDNARYGYPVLLNNSISGTNDHKYNIFINARLKANFGFPVTNMKIYLVQANIEYSGGLPMTLHLKRNFICNVDTSSGVDINTLINSTVEIPGTFYQTGDLYLTVVFDRVLASASENIVLNKFEFETGGFIQAFWTAKVRNNINIPVITEQALCQKLIDKITNTTATYQAVVDPHNETLRIAAGESIRNFPTQYVHTSLNDFASYIRSCWGFEYEIVGNTIHFALRDNFFQNVPALTLPEINNIKLSVNEAYIYTGVKIGINLVQYLSINGTDEFRFLEEWSTGVQNVVNVLDLTSPYRTDSYGFQLLSEKQFVTNSTDDQSDNGIFVLHVKASGSNYILDRTAILTGVASPLTMFNACFSPRKCLVRNASLLGISTPVLKFTSTSGQADITIDGVSEKADIPVTSSLFSPDILDMEVGNIVDLPVIQNGLISCSYRGEHFQGFIKKISHFWGSNQKTSWTLFLKKLV